MCVLSCKVPWHTWRSEDNLQESVPPYGTQRSNSYFSDKALPQQAISLVL